MAKYDNYKNFKITIEDKVGIVVFDNPPINGLTTKGGIELLDILEKMKTDDEVRCLFFTHNGPDFSGGGADEEVESVAEGKTIEDVTNDAAILGGNLASAIINFPKPTVVSGTGLAWGGSAALYECFDIRIAGENFRLLDADPYWGTAGSWGLMTTYLPLWLGRNKFLDFILLGESFSAGQLLELGMVSRVYSETVLYPASLAIAKKLATSAPLVVKAYKERMHDVIYRNNIPEWRRKELELAAVVNASEDAKYAFDYVMRGEQYEFKGY